MQPLPRPLGAVCRALLDVWSWTGRAPGWRYRLVEEWGQWLSTQPLVGRLPNGCRVVCDLRDVVQRQIYFWGVFEPCEAWLFTQLIKPGMTIVDAGANIGQYTLLAAKCTGDTGTVHAFEPAPSVFERLSHNVACNGFTNVRLNRAALWCEDLDRISLGLDDEERSNVSRYTILSNANTISAPSVRLDSYAERCALARLDFLKIDIEGAEPFAIAGANKVLEKFGPLILLEVSPERLSRVGTQTRDLVATLSELGYRSWRLGDSAESSGELNDSDPIDIANVLFYRGDFPESLRSEWNYRRALRWARTGSPA